MKTSTVPQTKPHKTPAVPHDAIFIQLFGQILSGLASQIEQSREVDRGMYSDDIYGDALREREVFIVQRAFRLATIARAMIKKPSEQFSEIV